jgi:hypothetical protein
MGLKDCPDCWCYPCECGGVAKNEQKVSRDFAIIEVFDWLYKNNYLNGDYQKLYNEFINKKK